MGIRGVGKFVFYRWDHADGRVQPLVVGPAADPQGDVLAGLGAGRPAVPVDELVGEGGEERLCGGVIQKGRRVACSARALGGA